MAEIVPDDWLHWHSGRASQDHAIRLCSFCASIFPTDRVLADLAEEQIISELVGLAFHGRRTMERLGNKSVVISPLGFWPRSNAAKDHELNIWQTFGRIIHAKKIAVGWENFECSPKPYNGREARYAGYVEVTSDQGSVKIATGAVAASFIRSVLNDGIELNNIQGGLDGPSG